MRATVRLAALLVAAALRAQAAAADSPAALPDARQVVERLIDNLECLAERRAAWTYKLREREADVRRRRGAVTALEPREERLWQVLPVGGRRPFRRLLEKDGRRLTPREEAREDERLGRRLERKDHIHAREGEGDLKLGELLRAARLATLERLDLDGRPTLVLAVRGDPSFQPRSPSQKIARHLEGVLWVDEQDLQVVRAEATVGKVRFGAGLLATLEGAHLVFEQLRIEDGLWLPSRSQAEYRGRMLLLRRVDRLQAAEFLDHRRYGTEVEVRFEGVAESDARESAR